MTSDVKAMLNPNKLEHFFVLMSMLDQDLKYHRCFMYGIMTKELVIREIRINEAAGRGD